MSLLSKRSGLRVLLVFLTLRYHLSTPVRVEVCRINFCENWLFGLLLSCTALIATAPAFKEVGLDLTYEWVHIVIIWVEVVLLFMHTAAPSAWKYVDWLLFLDALAERLLSTPMWVKVFRLMTVLFQSFTAYTKDVISLFLVIVKLPLWRIWQYGCRAWTRILPVVIRMDLTHYLLQLLLFSLGLWLHLRLGSLRLESARVVVLKLILMSRQW